MKNCFKCDNNGSYSTYCYLLLLNRLVSTTSVNAITMPTNNTDYSSYIKAIELLNQSSAVLIMPQYDTVIKSSEDRHTYKPFSWTESNFKIPSAHCLLGGEHLV